MSEDGPVYVVCASKRTADLYFREQGIEHRRRRLLQSVDQVLGLRDERSVHSIEVTWLIRMGHPTLRGAASEGATGDPLVTLIDDVIRMVEGEIAAEVHDLPGGHRIHGHRLTACCEHCGLRGAMIEAYGFPTCAGANFIDGDATEVVERPALPRGS